MMPAVNRASENGSELLWHDAAWGWWRWWQWEIEMGEIRICLDKSRLRSCGELSAAIWRL